MRTAIRRRRLPIAAAGAAALMLSLLPVATAGAQTPQSRGIARACPDDIEDAFTDDSGSVHESAINCIAAFDIVQGTGGSSYSPSNPVTRAQMATFIAGTMQVAGYEFPADPEDAFEDDDGSLHEGNINRLAAVGVVQGTGGGNYSPTRSVSRAQMATFINNALGEVTGSKPASSEDFFSDDNGSAHEANINALASIGVVTGTGGGNYEPEEAVRRASMASFIARGADYLAEKGFWPTPPAGALSVTPSDAETVEVNATRSFLVQVEADTTLDIRLFHPDDIEVNAFGKVSFDDADGDDLADEGQPADEDTSTGTTTPAVITSVNGSAVSHTVEVNDVATAGGGLTFTISSNEPAEVVPVVWEDTTAENDRIDLFVSNEPAEPVGLGGKTTFVPQEAAQGQSTPTIQFEDLANDLFVSTNDRLYEYDANDTYEYRGTAIAMGDFESMINPGDILNVTYEPDAGARSVFNVTTDEVYTSPKPKATVVNADDESQADDVRVSFVVPENNSAGTVLELQRALAECSTGRTSEGAYSTIAEVEESPYLDENVSNGCYVYRIRAISPVSGNKADSPASDPVQVPSLQEDDSEPPHITDVRATTDNGTDGTGTANGEVDQGDVHRFRFDDTMAESTESGTYRISDADGTVVDVICAGDDKNANCDRNEAPELDPSGAVIARHTQLTVTFTETPDEVSPGDDGDMEYPAVIVNISSEFQDDGGNTVTLTGSDTTIQA